MTEAEKPDSPIWLEIASDIDDLAKLELALRRSITGAEFDDLKQTVAYQMLGAVRKDPGLLVRFENRDTRRAFISTALKFAAMSRKRDAWHRYARPLEDITPPETYPSPLEEVQRADRKDFLDKVAGKLPVRSDARFALGHFLLGITMEDYAMANGIHIRTAYRRFNKGIRELRRHLAELDILKLD